MIRLLFFFFPLAVRRLRYILDGSIALFIEQITKAVGHNSYYRCGFNLNGYRTVHWPIVAFINIARLSRREHLLAVIDPAYTSRMFN